VLVVINQTSPVSIRIGEYYASRRHIPARNICRLNTKPDEEISRDLFNHDIEAPGTKCLRAGHLEEKILYIVTTSGVPLRIQGSGGLTGDAASVDSELTLLYSDLRGRPHSVPGSIANPFFGKVLQPFRH